MDTHFGGKHGAAVTCDVCEGMCLDAVDGTLSAAEQAAFALHIAGCITCAEQFAEAQRGAAWMDMLKVHRPEPSAALLASILAKTTGAGAVTEVTGASSNVPAAAPLLPFPAIQLPSVTALPPVASTAPRGAGKLLLFGRKLAATASFGDGRGYLQPRLTMTAAMAFFSLALTMNMTGTRLSDLRPGALHRTVADAGANAVRTFQGMRVVYQVESKVSELRQNDGGDDAGPLGERRPTADSQPVAPAKPEGDAAPSAAPGGQSPASAPVPKGSSELRFPLSPEPKRSPGRLQTEVAWDGLRSANDVRTTTRKGA